MSLTLGWVELPWLLATLAALNVVSLCALLRAEVRVRRQRCAQAEPAASVEPDSGDPLAELIRRVEEQERRTAEETRATAA